MSKRDQRLRRWPSRNFLAELEPELRESHAIEDLARRSPQLRRMRRRLRVLSERVRAQVSQRDWVRFADALAVVQTAEFELAFNLAFENGITMARAESLRRRRTAAFSETNNKGAADLRAAIAGAASAPDQLLPLLLELAWAIACGAPRLPGRRVMRRHAREGSS